MPCSRYDSSSWRSQQDHGFRHTSRSLPSTQVCTRSGPNTQPQSAHPLRGLLLLVVAAVAGGVGSAAALSIMVWLLVAITAA